jgi:hypothetical protein
MQFFRSSTDSDWEDSRNEKMAGFASTKHDGWRLQTY